MFNKIAKIKEFFVLGGLVMSTSYGGRLSVRHSETRLGMEDEGVGFM